MNRIPNYSSSTNAAYEILKQYDGNYPQIDIMRLISKYRKSVSVHCYSNVAGRLGISVWDFISDYAESETGYTVYDKRKNRWIIYYNDTKYYTTIRFTLAHEFSHIILGHEEDNDINDKEANCCARNLLAPVPVRDEYKLKSVYEISNCFDISEPAASAVLSLNCSDHYYISRENYAEINDKVYCYLTGCTPAELYGY